MNEKFKIAIVGAGPGGLSAAARAAELGIPHVLLEASPDIANTVRRFQKGKLVMSEPMQLPLRSSLSFVVGSRESILDCWQQELADRRVHLLTNASVKAISGQCGDFLISLTDGDELSAEFVVLAIGVQGNIRKLGVPGEDLPGVQYQLDDPEEYDNEVILVVGGGDAGIENALALATRNQVILINRQEEFANCREVNFKRLDEAVKAGRIETLINTSVVRVEAHPGNRFPLVLEAQSPDGTKRIECHRIIARLGALPPRRMLERFGICFPHKDETVVPQLSERYESNVPGLYIVGTLAGYPLMKQALNQGYEVVEYILGNPIEPADQSLLLEKFSRIPGLTSVADGIVLLGRAQPLLASLTTLQLREFMLDSDVLAPRPSKVIFMKNDYGNSFFSVLQGTVHIHVEKQEGETAVITLSGGDFFGEIGLLSGRRRTATVIAGEGCVLVETPRRSMLKLLDSVPAVQRKLDEVSLKRIVRSCFGGSLAENQIDHLVQDATTRRYAAGETLFHEGDEPDALYMIRSGSVTVSRLIAGKESVVAYVSAGSYVGEMALASKMPRTATVRAAAQTDVMMLEAERFKAVLDQNAFIRSEVAERHLDGVRSRESDTCGKNGNLVQFLMDQGIGEATDILLIDYSRCIRCNNCEKACADVHDGNSRLDRAVGPTFQKIHVPASCRHCESPHCMKDCPPNAIHRSPKGEIFIGDNCIGCGNCQSNCPYGVIQMRAREEYRRPSLWQLISGRDPGASHQIKAENESGKIAVKCDMCMGIAGGAACVRACPTGAAIRGGPVELMAMFAN